MAFFWDGSNYVDPDKKKVIKERRKATSKADIAVPLTVAGLALGYYVLGLGGFHVSLIGSIAVATAGFVGGKLGLVAKKGIDKINKKRKHKIKKRITKKDVFLKILPAAGVTVWGIAKTALTGFGPHVIIAAGIDTAIIGWQIMKNKKKKEENINENGKTK